MNNEQQNLEDERRMRLRGARRVVIKLGTSTVTTTDGSVCAERVESVARAIAELKVENRNVVLVSSGAVGLGAGELNLPRERLHDLVTRQACAAVGQNLLMHAYKKLFEKHKVKIAQILLTEDDFTDRRRYTNLRRTMEKLLKLGVLPIINENDTVSTEELVYLTPSANRIFSDNDRLAALVASKLEADALVLLTNVDGLLANKSGASLGGGEKSEIISLVTSITPEIKALAAGPSAGGRGGMITKLEAADIAVRAGSIAVIANGAKPDALNRVFAGEPVGTCFLPNARVAGKRRWIAFAADVRGRLTVNEGARAALTDGKASLLASGVIRIENHFEALDVVSIVDDEGCEFARGIANCASQEAEQLVRETAADESAENEKKNQKKRVLVTRNNIVLLN